VKSHNDVPAAWQVSCSLASVLQPGKCILVYSTAQSLNIFLFSLLPFPWPLHFFSKHFVPNLDSVLMHSEFWWIGLIRVVAICSWRNCYQCNWITSGTHSPPQCLFLQVHRPFPCSNPLPLSSLVPTPPLFHPLPFIYFRTTYSSLLKPLMLLAVIMWPGYPFTLAQSRLSSGAICSVKSFLSAFEAIFLSFPRYRGPRRASYTRKEGEELIKENCFSCVGRFGSPIALCWLQGS
jgi:hypothetical protein